jgi:formylglycine-generating enzyme required for sulfatase activity
MCRLAVVAVMVATAWVGCGKDDKPTTTLPPTGACCDATGTCTLTTQAACTSPATWQGAGTTCAPDPCAQPTGACCDTVGTCTLTTQAACASPATWQGAGTTCAPDPCPQQNRMVLIPAGTFTMGSPTDEPGRSPVEIQHQVTLTRAIYVSTYEVTQSEWQSVMGWNESSFQGPNRPVEEVTWFDAVKYCNERSAREDKRLVYTITGVRTSGNHITAATVTANWNASGYRLLTEAEWEYACRASSTTAFCNGPITHADHDCGDDPGLDLVGWYCGNAGHTTHDVGGKASNDWGLQDMHGNVLEWCWDLYELYPAGPITDPVGPASGWVRVFRGGGWNHYAPYCRSALRSFITPDHFDFYIGLRVARKARADQ